jgi:hypothetical protein
LEREGATMTYLPVWASLPLLCAYYLVEPL